MCDVCVCCVVFWWLLCIAGCFLIGVCCLLCDVYCSVSVVYGLLFGV